MDSRLFIIQEHDPEALCKSFDELNLFQDSQGDLVTVSIAIVSFPSGILPILTVNLFVFRLKKGIVLY